VSATGSKPEIQTETLPKFALHLNLGECIIGKSLIDESPSPSRKWQTLHDRSIPVARGLKQGLMLTGTIQEHRQYSIFKYLQEKCKNVLGDVGENIL
jgi:hypothetical protein